MDKALFIAMTGAKHNMLAQQARANNLANVNTTGFKADLEQARAMPVFGQSYPTRAYALTERPATDVASGQYDQTGNPLDVAVNGDGWLAVQAPDGTEAYTRRGDLSLDANGIMRTGNGLPVIGSGGPIVLPPASRVSIGEDGTISVMTGGNGQPMAMGVDQLKLVNPQANDIAMDKGLDGLMRPRNGQAELDADPNVRVASGMIETSNVNAVNELTHMIALSRQYEMNVKMMKTVDDNGSSMNSVLRMS